MNTKQYDPSGTIFHFENLKLLLPKTCIDNPDPPATGCDEKSDPPKQPADAHPKEGE